MTEQYKNRIFWAVLILLVICSIVSMYVRIFIFRDYILVKEVPCDSANESCLVHTPEELCTDSEDSNCLQNTETQYYKIIHKKASHVADCDPGALKEGETCPDLVCEVGEFDCYYEGN